MLLNKGEGLTLCDGGVGCQDPAPRFFGGWEGRRVGEGGGGGKERRVVAAVVWQWWGEGEGWCIGQLLRVWRDGLEANGRRAQKLLEFKRFKKVTHTLEPALPVACTLSSLSLYSRPYLHQQSCSRPQPLHTISSLICA